MAALEEYLRRLEEESGATLDQFHERVKKLTGDQWCPYPSARFIKAVMNIADDRAVKFINMRRGFLAPNFWGTDPMDKELKELGF